MLEKLKNLRRGESRGFTLIEIVLVLAIAGLIIVIVFIAVKGAQQAQRDNARRDYVNRLTAQGINLISAAGGGTLDCTTVVAALKQVPKPNINGGIDVTTNAAGTANVNVDAACNFTVTLENGGNYSKQATPPIQRPPEMAAKA